MVGIDFTLCLASEDRGKTRVMRDGLWSGQREGEQAHGHRDDTAVQTDLSDADAIRMAILA